MKRRGVLTDSHLCWRYHIDYISSKISNKHHCQAYQYSLKALSFLNWAVYFLWFDYMGQICQFEFKQIPKAAKTNPSLSFSDRKSHAIPLFARSGVLPLNILPSSFQNCLIQCSSVRGTRSTLVMPGFQLQVIIISSLRYLHPINNYYLFLKVVRKFGIKFLFSYANSAKTQRFWRLKRYMVCCYKRHY